MLKSGTESLQGVIHSLSLSLGKVAIRLDFTLDVLKFSLELFLGLNALHQHDIVISVHLDQLIIHCSKRYILILLANITLHIFFNKFLLGCRYRFLRFAKNCVSCCNKCT